MTPEHHAAVKAAKDAAAAAVLISACFAGLVGMTILALHLLPEFIPEVICGVAMR